ncbi:MAG: hypothetical protein CMG07_00990 [Candidatus Marinimicrobia bacterium]|nr:hypothetical protein [Candidatus Neomarinimicrobiota bacterium]
MKFIIIFQLIAFCICETNFNNSMLLDKIKSDKSWKDLKVVNENTLIKIKEIDGFDLPAISIQRVINVDPNEVKDILIDILNYKNVLKSSGSLKTKIISKNNQYLDGYQFIKSELPFISSREYYFRMYYSKNFLDNNTLVHWYLLNKKNKTKGMVNADDAVYLDFGAGIWLFKKIEKNKYLISYRLYMDPGGSLPDFIINKVNESSIFNIFNDVIEEASKSK